MKQECRGCEKELYIYYGYSTTCGQCTRYNGDKTKEDKYREKK